MKIAHAILSLAVFAWSQHHAVAATIAITNRPLRVAILECETDLGGSKTNGLTALAAHMLAGHLSRDARVEVIERADVTRLLHEHEVSLSGMMADPLQVGQWLGADWLLFIRFTTLPPASRLEVAILEVASASVLGAASVETTQLDADTVNRLTSALVKQIPKALEAAERDRTRPAVSVLGVQNVSRLRRLDYLAPVARQLLEQAIGRTGRYRLLGREYAREVRPETELASLGVIRPSAAVVARYADVTVSVEMEEQYRPGLTFDQTPLDIRVTLDRRAAAAEKVVVSGMAGTREDLLRAMADKTALALGLSPSPVSTNEQARILEANRLLQQAISTHLARESGPYASDDIDETGYYAPRIKLLEQALYLYPELTEARYWLGLYLGIGNKRAVRELKTYIQNTPCTDARSYDLSSGSVWDSREPGVLRERAYHDLIWGYSALINAKLRMAEGRSAEPLDAAQKEECRRDAIAFQKDLTRITVAYLTEPPLKHGPDHIYLLPSFGLRPPLNTDPGRTTQWFLFLDSLYGKDHERYNVMCPFLCAAREVLRMGYPKQALELYQRAVIEHGHNRTNTTRPGTMDDLLGNIYMALGRTNEALILLHAPAVSSEDVAPAAQRKADVPSPPSTKLPPPPPLPPGLLVWPPGFPPDLSLAAIGCCTNERYFFMTDYNQVGMSTYLNQRLFRQTRGGGVLEEMKGVFHGKSARVSTIIPLGDYVWFGTYLGLGCFDTRKQEWLWFAEKEGLPTHRITAGCESDGILWFAGESVVFSFDPRTHRIATYLLDAFSEVRDVALVKGTPVVVAHSGTVAAIDPQTGSWNSLGPALYSWCGRMALYDGRLWYGTREGLAVIPSTNHSDCRVIFRTSAARQPNCPLLGKVGAVAADGQRLWMLCCQDGKSPGDDIWSLAAFEPRSNTWYGPLQTPGYGYWLQVDGDDVWLLGGKPAKFSKSGFLAAATAAGLCVTTEAFQKTRRKNP